MRQHAVLAAAVLLIAGPALAQINEIEPNDSIGEAQIIQGEAEVSGVRENETPQDFDYFLFTQLMPGEDYEVSVANSALGIGHFTSAGVLLESDAFNGSGLEITATADGNGELIIGVCGHVAPSGTDLDCTEQAAGFGEYLLIVELPEPGASMLALVALAAVAGARRRQQAFAS